MSKRMVYFIYLLTMLCLALLFTACASRNTAPADTAENSDQADKSGLLSLSDMSDSQDIITKQDTSQQQAEGEDELVHSVSAVWAPAIGPDDFVIRVGETDFDLCRHDIDVAIWSSGEELEYHKDDTREGYDYRVNTEEAVFLIPDRDTMFACGARLTEKGVTARGIRIGSELDELLVAYPETDDVWDDGSVTIYTYQAPNAPESLPADVAVSLNDERPDYFYKIIIMVQNTTQKVESIYFTRWYP